MNKQQGDTTNIVMSMSDPIPEGLHLKLGLYSLNGKPIWETYYPDDGEIQKVDDTHYTLEMDYELTRKFSGSTTMRAVVFSPDHEFVNAGENSIPINWVPEPATKTLR